MCGQLLAHFARGEPVLRTILARCAIFIVMNGDLFATCKCDGGSRGSASGSGDQGCEAPAPPAPASSAASLRDAPCCCSLNHSMHGTFRTRGCSIIPAASHRTRPSLNFHTWITPRHRLPPASKMKIHCPWWPSTPIYNVQCLRTKAYTTEMCGRHTRQNRAGVSSPGGNNKPPAATRMGLPVQGTRCPLCKV